MVRGGIILTAALLAALGATADPAWAQTTRIGGAERMTFGDAAALVAQSCGADIDANCRGVNFDANRLRECLSRNTDVISAQCRSDYLRAFDAIQKRILARVGVANACAREIVKLCNGSTRETSKSIGCLTTAKGVSRNCIQAMDDAGYR
ncbi:hypothetical protein [Bradyrhizobium sp. Tv2a-2]|uniref:hypothetical protein n=1 Tax=Bradyrhizobium sp. Tv2a-2 TaxID=113395 RepID=UPI00040887B9